MFNVQASIITIQNNYLENLFLYFKNIFWLICMKEFYWQRDVFSSFIRKKTPTENKKTTTNKFFHCSLTCGERFQSCFCAFLRRKKHDLPLSAPWVSRKKKKKHIQACTPTGVFVLVHSTSRRPVNNSLSKTDPCWLY